MVLGQSSRTRGQGLLEKVVRFVSKVIFFLGTVEVVGLRPVQNHAEDWNDAQIETCRAAGRIFKHKTHNQRMAPA